MKHEVLAPFGANLWLCSRPKHWRRLRQQIGAFPKKVPDSVGYTQLAVHNTGATATAFYIDERRASGPSGLIGTCAHEAAHAARFLLEHYGETVRTHEVEPYFVGWITEWLWINLNKEN